MLFKILSISISIMVISEVVSKSCLDLKPIYFVSANLESFLLAWLSVVHAPAIRKWAYYGVYQFAQNL